MNKSKHTAKSPLTSLSASAENPIPATSPIPNEVRAELSVNFDLEKYLSYFPEITPAGREFCRKAMIAPCRESNGQRGNKTRWPSQKTGETSPLESDSSEMPAAAMADNTPGVLFYLVQPGRCTVNSGSVQTYCYPDILLLTITGPVLLECRTNAGMAKKVLKTPALYQLTKGGRYHSAPIAESVAKLGFTYRINTERDYSGTFVRNLLLLQQHLSAELLDPVTSDEKALFLASARDKPGISLTDIPISPASRRSDVFHSMLVSGEIYAHLDRVDLRNQQAVQLFSSRIHLSVYELFLGRNEQSIPLTGQISALLTEGAIFTASGVTYKVLKHLPTGVRCSRIPDGKIDTIPFLLLQDLEVMVNPVEGRLTADFLLANLSEKQMRQLLRTRKRLLPYLTGGDLSGKTPGDRTLRRKLQSYRLAEKSWGVGELGLIPRTHLRGNRTSPKSPESIAILKTAIKEVYLQPGKVSAQWLHHVYSDLAKSAGIIPKDIMSYESVVRRLKKIPRHTVVGAQEGKRAALVYRPPHQSKSILGSPNGQASWALGHIDHTKMDCLVFNPETGKNERPWISSLVDAFDGRRLARHVWFGHPDKYVVIQVLKNCIERHGVLPKRIRCDWGSEFRSTMVMKVLASVGVAISYRKVGEPRDGGPVETSFSAMNKIWIHNTKGNTKALQKPRTTSKTHYPENFAVHEFGSFLGLVDEFINSENKAPLEHKLSPDERYAEFIGKFGYHFAHRIPQALLDNVKFLPQTNNTRVVSSQATIRVNCATYSSIELAKYVGKEVSVFTDDSDPRTVKAEAHGSRTRITCTVVDSELKYAHSVEHAREIAQRRRDGTHARKVKAREVRSEFVAKVRKVEARASTTPPVVQFPSSPAKIDNVSEPTLSTVDYNDLDAAEI